MDHGTANVKMVPVTDKKGNVRDIPDLYKVSAIVLPNSISNTRAHYKAAFLSGVLRNFAMESSTRRINRLQQATNSMFSVTDLC